MPGFRINNIGGNGTALSPEARFYTSFSWEIPSIFFARDETTFLPNFSSFNDNQSSLVPYDTDVKDIMLKTAQLPSVSFNNLKAKGASIEYKYAGQPNFEPIKITWYDTIKLGPKIKDWTKRIWDPVLGLRLAESYKFNTIIRKFTNDYSFVNGTNEQNVVEYELFGSWPSTFKESDLTYSEASIKTIEVTLTCDYFVVR